MPGTPATSPNLDLPRFDNATDPADFSGSVNPIVDGLDVWLEAYGGALTTFPTTGLFQGREVYIQTTAMAALGVRWRFSYNLASASIYKWEFAGGSPWMTEVLGQGVSLTTSYGDLATGTTAGPSWAIPFPGDWLITHGFEATQPGGQPSSQIVYAALLRAGATTETDRAAITPSATSATSRTVAKTWTAAEVTASPTVKQVYKMSTAAAYEVRHRFLSVLPVRLG